MKGQLPMFEVITGDKKFRTHSLDRVARRLYGRNAVVIIQKQTAKQTEGIFAVLDKRSGNSIYKVKESFLAA